MTGAPEQPRLPEALLRPEQRRSWAWIVPIVAVAVAGWLGYQAWAARGLTITVQLDDGYGLRPGDPVRYRGISVGQVQTVTLTPSGDGVVATARLSAGASHLARAGARIWVVRPQLGTSGIAGLETLVGPRYLAMLPGDGSRQRRFVGLAEPPVVESIDAGDLEVLLEAPQRAGLRRGVPVLYRQIPIGHVLSVGLTTDGGAVEARVHIRKAYVQLIRPETRFWAVGGVQVHLGISGVSVEMESLESLLTGGVALATPPTGSDVVRTGHRFKLAGGPEGDWLEWQPRAVIGSSFLPLGAMMPSPVRAVIGWKAGRWIKSHRSRRGWMLPTDRGLLAPLDLLQTPEDVEAGSVVLEVAGQTLSLSSELAWRNDELGLLAYDLESRGPRWSSMLVRPAQEPEDCIAVADPASTPLPLAASRMTVEEKTWSIDAALMIDESWHGASVLARSDGYLIGVLVVEDETVQVALLPAGWPTS
jgi:hypothetical protein